MSSASIPSSIPIIAIIGRPNVGKSSLFNRLIKTRKAIVHQERGVTRDRVEMDWKWGDYCVRLVDTGGAAFDPNFPYAEKIFEQVSCAIKASTIVLFVVDGKEGLSPFDDQMASILRRSGRPVLLVVNKIDHSDMSGQEFFKLGFKELFCVSASHNLGIADLVLKIESCIQPVFKDSCEMPSFAIVGKPNVGKSTLVNQLIGDKRLIVDDLPGTTRDAIEVPFKWQDKEFVLIDTAGMRKHSKVKESVEFFSVNRALKSVISADLVLLLVDAPEGLTGQDVDILKNISEEGKGCVIGFNKWDLTKKIKKGELFQIINDRWPHLRHYPKLTLSASKGEGIANLMRCLMRVYQNCQKRISTPQLNKILQQAYKRFEPPSCKGKMLRIYYMTQVDVLPPEFILFVNDRDMVKQNYLTYLEHQIRQRIDFLGVPLRFRIKRNREAKES